MKQETSISKPIDFNIEVQYRALYRSQSKVLRYRSLGTLILPYTYIEVTDFDIEVWQCSKWCLVAATNVLLSNSSAPAGFRPARSRVTVQAGLPGAGRTQNKVVAHRMCSDIRVCTSMCPLNQDQKSAVKLEVFTGISIIYPF